MDIRSWALCLYLLGIDYLSLSRIIHVSDFGLEHRCRATGKWGAFNGLIIKRLMKFVFSGRAVGAARRRYVPRLAKRPTWTPLPPTEKLQRKSFIAWEREWNEELCRPLSGLFSTWKCTRESFISIRQDVFFMVCIWISVYVTLKVCKSLIALGKLPLDHAKEDSSQICSLLNLNII